MCCRGIRGATTVEGNSRSDIVQGTKELLGKMVAVNDLNADDVACSIFTTTSDLNAEFPAVAARELGWNQTALLCGHEMAVPGSLQHCIRILVLWNTDKRHDQIVHVYLRGATSLRPNPPDE